MFRRQGGLTLIELVIAIAITAVLGAAVTSAIAQVLNMNARSSNHMVAIRQVQNAGYWVSRDAQMSQRVNTSLSGKFLRLEWTGWDNAAHWVEYTLEDAPGGLKNLLRNYDGNSLVVAQYVDPANTSRAYSSGKLTFTVTASVGDAARRGIETRTYEMNPRPNQ